MSRYDDIIDLPHHVSPTRSRMSSEARAAQFAPFAALTAHGMEPEFEPDEAKPQCEEIAFDQDAFD